MQAIQKYVEKLEIGEIQIYKNLGIAPVLGNDSELDYLVLGDAVNQGLVITEAKEGRTVPFLYAENRTGKNVLAIIGEYVVGGSQNRTLVRNIYFDKNFSGNIPVRCIEAGRWTNQEHVQFKSAGRATLKAATSANQGETWGAVDEDLHFSGVASATANLDEVYQKRKDDFENFQEKFRVHERQIGNIAVFLDKGKKLYVLDLFDKKSTFEKHHSSLIQSYALEARLDSQDKVTLNRDEARGFLDSIDSMNFQRQESVSLGEDFNLVSDNMKGSALFFDDNFVYMNLYTPSKANPQSRTIRTGFARRL